MSWNQLLGHDKQREDFQRALQKGKLASTFLFAGPQSVGKKRFALNLAQSLLCKKTGSDQLDFCGTCDDCQQVQAGTHPDLLTIGLPEGKSKIPVELLIGERKNRMQEGLCYEITLKAFRGGRKIAIIDDADYLNVEGANSLLKTLEEPPSHSIIILISHNLQRQLPTVRSRCQIIRFQPLKVKNVTQILSSQLVETDFDQNAIDTLARLSQGSLAKAMLLADERIQEFQQQLFRTISQSDFPAVSISKQTNEFVDQAGKDASARRKCLNNLIELVIDLFQAVLYRQLPGDNKTPNLESPHVERLWQQLQNRPEATILCIEKSLEAQQQIEANANLNSVIDAWFDQLSMAMRLSYV